MLVFILNSFYLKFYSLLQRKFTLPLNANTSFRWCQYLVQMVHHRSDYVYRVLPLHTQYCLSPLRHFVNMTRHTKTKPSKIHRTIAWSVLTLMRNSKLSNARNIQPKDHCIPKIVSILPSVFFNLILTTCQLGLPF